MFFSGILIWPFTVFLVIVLAQLIVSNRTKPDPLEHSCSRFYECKDKSKCIPLDHACDGHFDCDDASDESNDCYDLCFNHNCTYGCVPSQSGVECACSTTSAADPCGDLEVIPILYSTRSEIWSFDLHSTVSHQVLKDLTWVHDIDVDVSGQRVFWTDSVEKKVYAYRLGADTSTGRDIIVDIGLVNPRGLAYEWNSQQLYIVDASLGAVVACTHNGSACSVVVKGLGSRQPEDIVVDPESRQMFWTELSHPARVMSSDLDGKNSMPIITDLGQPGKMVIDQETGRLYVVDMLHKSVRYVDLNNRTSVQFVLGVVSPSALTIVQSALVWFEKETGDMKSANKLNGEDQLTLMEQSNSIQVTGAAALYRTVQPPGDSPCKNALCTQQCLPSNSDSSYACACPPDMILSSDKNSCTWSHDSRFLFVATSSEILQIPVNNIGTLAYRPLSSSTMKNVGTLDYNPVTKDIFYSSVNSNGHPAIFRLTDVYQRQFRVQTIEDHAEYLSEAQSLIVDWVADNVLWLNSYEEMIEVFKVDGSARSSIFLEYADNPVSIAANFTAGYLYISCWGDDPRIEKCHMDGSHCHIFVDEVHQPHHLTLHRGRLYWNDLDLAEFSSVDAADGTDMVHHHWSVYPQAFAVYGTLLYYTDASTNAIHVFNISSEMNVTDYRLPHHQINDVIIHGETPALQSLPCHQSNGGCSHICLSMPENQRQCMCPANMELGDDEQTCEVSSHPCPEDYVFCESSQRCILPTSLCSGKETCRSLVIADVCRVPKSQECSAEENVCEQQCTKTDTGPVCSCYDGFQLQDDRPTCRDVDECEVRNGNCSQRCSNRVGSYSCSCVSGYTLSGDKATCFADDRDTAYLLVAANSFLKQVSMDGENEENLVSKAGDVAIDVECRTGDIVWSQQDSAPGSGVPIQHYQHDVTTTLQTVNSSVHSLCVDWVTGNIYYTASTQPPLEAVSRLVVCGGGGHFCKTLKRDDTWLPYALILHPEQRWMFWINIAKSTIERAFMDGSGTKSIVSEVMGRRACLTIDHVTERLFWIQGSVSVEQVDSIETAKLDGTDRYTLASYRSRFFTSIATFEGFLYLTETLLNSIVKVSSFSGRPVLGTVRAMAGTPTRLRIVHPLTQPDVSNPCAEKACKYLCVLAESGASCLCPDDVPIADCDGNAASNKVKPAGPINRLSELALQETTTQMGVRTNNRRPPPIISYDNFIPVLPTFTTPSHLKYHTATAVPTPSTTQKPFRMIHLTRRPFEKLWNTASPPCNRFCVNGGICSIRNGTPVCKCPAGYHGSRCDIPPGIVPKLAGTTNPPDEIILIDLRNDSLPNTTTTTSPSPPGNKDVETVGMVIGMVVLTFVLVALSCVVYRYCRTRRMATDLISRITYRNPNFKQNAEEGVVLVSDPTLYRCAFTEDDDEQCIHKKGRCWKSSSSSGSSTDSAISSRTNSPTVIYRPVSPTPNGH